MKKIGLTLWVFILAAGPAVADGCHVDQVDPNSAAERGGLKVGDTIVSANGKTLRRHEDLAKAVGEAATELRMFVRRGEKTDEVTVALETAPAKGSRLGVGCSYESGGMFSGNPAVESRVVPPHSISLAAGGAFPLAKLDTGVFGDGEQTVGSPGFAINGEYLYRFSPRLDVGIEAGYSGLGTHSFSAPPFTEGLSLRSSVLMAIAKVRSTQSVQWAPYVLFGLGVHSSEFEWTLTPDPGYGWTSGDPDESRSIVKERQVGVAMALGLGVDMEFGANYVASLEGRLDVIGKRTYDANAFGNALGLRSVEGGGLNGLLLIRLGKRFGAAGTPSSAIPSSPSENHPDSPGAM